MRPSEEIVVCDTRLENECPLMGLGRCNRAAGSQTLGTNVALSVLIRY